MGFKRSKVFVLEFEDEEYAGLEVRARGASVAGILGILDLGVLFSDEKMDLKAIKEISNLFRAFGGCPAECAQSHPELEEHGLKHYENRIVSWNLEEENGVPVPANYQGLMSQDFDFARELAMHWLDGVLGTPGPLDGNSNDGGPSEVGSIPMESL